eukprot:Polyplicarium_translucidae@DN3282_c0_g2_i20.p1
MTACEPPVDVVDFTQNWDTAAATCAMEEHDASIGRLSRHSVLAGLVVGDPSISADPLPCAPPAPPRVGIVLRRAPGRTEDLTNEIDNDRSPNRGVPLEELPSSSDPPVSPAPPEERSTFTENEKRKLWEVVWLRTDPAELFDFLRERRAAGGASSRRTAAGRRPPESGSCPKCGDPVFARNLKEGDVSQFASSSLNAVCHLPVGERRRFFSEPEVLPATALRCHDTWHYSPGDLVVPKNGVTLGPSIPVDEIDETTMEARRFQEVLTASGPALWLRSPNGDVFEGLPDELDATLPADNSESASSVEESSDSDESESLGELNEGAAGSDDVWESESTSAESDEESNGLSGDHSSD